MTNTTMSTTMDATEIISDVCACLDSNNLTYITQSRSSSGKGYSTIDCWNADTEITIIIENSGNIELSASIVDNDGNIEKEYPTAVLNMRDHAVSDTICWMISELL